MTDETSTPDSAQRKDALLSQDQKQAVAAWLTAHWTNWACPFHGPTTWNIGDLIIGAPAFVPVGGSSIPKVYPVVVLTCAQCGYTVMVNALIAGLLEPEPKPDTGQPAGPSMVPGDE